MLCPDDVVAPFLDAVPPILAMIPAASSELRSCALMTLGAVVAKLGPHSLKFVSSVINVILDHVVTLQTTALAALRSIVKYVTEKPLKSSDVNTERCRNSWRRISRICSGRF